MTSYKAPMALAVGALALSSSLTNAATLEEVVVTAQKRAESIQDIPLTVTAISNETLNEFGVDNLFKLADLVPGMVFSRAPDDGLALTLRGLGTPARTQSFDQSVALFLDGMFLGKGRMYSTAFFDVERIEVIKGTQSTLLGKNTSLGAISITSRKPGDEFAGNIQGGAEVENGGWNAEGGVDLPVSDDFSVRVAGRYVDQDGWVENVLTGKDVPADEEKAVRLTALWTPTDNLDVNFLYQYADSERTGNGFQYIDQGNWLPPDAIAIYGEAKLDDSKTAICPQCPTNESFHDTEVDLANVTIDYDLGGVTLTSVTSYGTYDLRFFDDFDFGNAFDETTFLIFDPGQVDLYSTYFERNEEYDQWSQEFRLASDTGETIEYMVGAFYFYSDWTSSEAQFFNTPNFPPPDPGQIFNGPFTNNFDQETETWSAFGQMTFNFSDQWRASLGLRYTDEQKDVSFVRVQGNPQTLWNSVINPPFSDPDLKFDDDFLNGNLSVQFTPTQDAMFYAAFGVGSKTGGYAESAEVASGNPALDVDDGGARVKSEEATTYELGAKLTLLDGAATFNAALFYTEVEDFQETSFVVTEASAQFLTRNIDAESEGFEFDAVWQTTDSLRLMAAATYADTTNEGDGTKLAQAPEWTGYVGANFETQITSGLVFTSAGFVRYRDNMFSQINETFASEDMTSLDLNFSLSDVDNVWRVSLLGTNLTDETVTDFSGPPAAPIGALFGAPPGDTGITADSPSQLRTIWVQLAYNF
ncbi:MAG: TonB-dependent receptor [Pseudomonadota bacterium]